MRSFRIPALAAGILLAPLFLATARSYPISPVTLWQLVEEADVVIVGQVDEIVESEEADEDSGIPGGAISATAIGPLGFGDSIARVRILELLKGSPDSTILEVDYPRGLICPAPPRYYEGDVVLAFLEKDGRRWSTVGLSYGTLYPDPDALPVFRELIAQAVSLQSAYLVRDFARRAWLVRAAARRATRWHGLYELMSESDPAHSSFDTSSRAREHRKPWSRERRAIMRGFVREPSADRTLGMAMAFAGREPDVEFDTAVLGQVERILAEDPHPYWLPEALKAIAERYGARNVPKDLGLKRNETYRIDAGALRAAWTSLRDASSIPRIDPAPEVPLEKPGVGSRTPN